MRRPEVLMRVTRTSARGFLVLAVLAAVVAAGPAQAQDFPTKPINVLIPFGAGGASDLILRTFVHLSPEVLGQPMVVQPKPGGAGAIASDLVAQSKPDGYTLLFGHTNSNSILPAIEGRSKGPDDLASVCRVNTSGNLFIAQPSAPFNTFKEMIAWAKANPGKLSVSVATSWSMVDFTWKQMEVLLGIKLRIVTYDGGCGSTGRSPGRTRPGVSPVASADASTGQGRKTQGVGILPRQPASRPPRCARRPRSRATTG